MDADQRESAVAEALYRMNGQAWYGRDLGDWNDPASTIGGNDHERARWRRQARVLAALDQPALGADERAVKTLRPYRADAPLVAVHESEWEDAEEAFAQVPQLEDALANANAYVARLPDKIADYLLTHVGGDESDQWQAGHNYAMTEAARLVREKYYALDEGDPAPEDGLLTARAHQPTPPAQGDCGHGHLTPEAQRECDEWTASVSTPPAQAEAVAAVERVRALADLWERDAVAHTPHGAAAAIRAALAPADTGEGE